MLDFGPLRSKRDTTKGKKALVWRGRAGARGKNLAVLARSGEVLHWIGVGFGARAAFGRLAAYSATFWPDIEWPE